MRLPVKLLIPVVATLLWVLPPAAQSQDNRDTLDFEQWTVLAKRAEGVIKAAAASDTALLQLRSELSGWKDRAESVQEPLQNRVNQLELRIGALGEGDDSQAGSSEDIEARRTELTSELARAKEPLQTAQEIVRWSEGLISGIDGILGERREARIFSAAPSPLFPSAWPGAVARITEYYGGIRREIADTLSSDAQTRALQSRLPAAILLLLLGVFLLTTARNWAGRVTARVWERFGRTGEVGAAGIDNFLVQFLLPAAGIQSISGAVISTGLFLRNAELFASTIPQMGIAVFGASWLGSALFSNSPGAVLAGRMGLKWSAMLRRAIYLAGWIVAARLLADAVSTGIDKLDPVSGVIGFPVLIAGSIVLFLLGRYLSEYSAARPQEASDYGIADSTIAVLATLSRIAAVAGVLAGAAGFAVGARILVFSSLQTLALFGLVLVVQVVIADHVSLALHRFRRESGKDRSGLVFVVTGFVLFGAALPELLVLWGVSDKELSEIWVQILNGIQIGGRQFTVYSLLTLIIVFVAVYAAARLVQSILAKSVLPNTDLDIGAQRAITTGAGYVGIILAVVAGVSAAGLDLTNLAIVAGALSVGIGFGLQAVVSNFVSGVILLIERPINVGDWIQTGGVSGTVKRISVRSTLIETFDRAAVVVPNTDLMSNQVVNWTLTNRICRTIVPVGVAYGSDTRRIERLLLEIASEHPAVLKDPPPSVIFMGFGADALEFELRAILNDTNYIIQAKSDLNFAIAERFEAEGISIPFPQRDVWIRNAQDAGKENPGGTEQGGAEV